jgi:tetratricopeptide (TPR) repeat protein
MPLSARSRRFLVPLIVTGILSVALCGAQQTPPPNQTQTVPGPGASSSSRVPGLNPDQSPGQAPRLAAPAEQANASKAPSLMDPAGPTVSLETSEAMFDMAVALNACGYDAGLDESAPVRKQVRAEVDQALLGSARARDDRDKLCLFIDQHRLDDPGRSLAQYVSLALYLTPPPEMTPSVESEDLPPDASGVAEILPIVRKFADDLELHVIWLQNRPAYENLVNELHEPLTQMIVGTNYYLKMPANTSNARRFLVVLEPMLSPEETNARVYGTDYVVVASPKDGQIQMHLVRHAYLHYEIEPLLYAREDSLDRLLPVLKAVSDAPLQFTFKSDIVALVIESMIRAIEARTMDTGVPLVKIPAGLSHSELEPYDRARSEAQAKIAAIKQQNVDHSMAQGYVLTQYFYDQLIAFEHNPESLEEAIGPMVYGMDMATEVHRARQITFDAHGEDDPMSHAPLQPKGLELAELKLMKGDVAGASEMAQKALATHSGDAGQADFILARVDLMSGKTRDAQSAFQNALNDSKDSRTLAWSHIFLGRILDAQGQACGQQGGDPEDCHALRDQAITEYKAALTVRDGQPDTKAAAENGIRQPFAVPHRAAADGAQGAPGGHPPNSTPPQGAGTPPPPQ